MMTPEQVKAQIARLNTPKPKKRLSWKVIVLSIAIALIVVNGVIGITSYFKYVGLVDEVKTVLAAVPSAMTKAKSGSNGYPVALPAGISTDKNIQLSGGGSFDGATYCVTGTNLTQPSIVYYIDSTTKQPQPGSCQSATSLPKPTVVSNLQRTIVSSSQIALSWSVATYAVNYTLQCATDQAFEKGLITSTGTTPTGLCDNAAASTQYYVRVRGNNGTGPGPWSSTLSVTTDAWSTPPSDMTISAISPTQIKYSWSPISGAENYVVQWASDVNFTDNLVTTTQSATSGIAKDLKPDTTYFFHVKAVTSNFSAVQAVFSGEIYTNTPGA